MRKMKNLLNRIPRPLKACVCSILVILLAVVYYIALGCPTLTLRQEFRRAEKAHLVGPSKIVDTLDKGQYDEFTRLLVGETEEGIVFFGKYFTTSGETGWRDKYAYRFYYLPKTGDITIAPAPSIFGSFWDWGGAILPVYVFTEHDNAVRAEISFTVRGSYTKTNLNDGSETIVTYGGSFSQETVRASDGGPFRFFFEAKNGKEGLALGQFSTLVTDPHFGMGHVDTPICVTVRLFDANDQLIKEDTLAIHSPASSN